MASFTDWVPATGAATTKRPAEGEEDGMANKKMKTGQAGPSYKNVFKQLSQHRTGLLFELDNENPQDQSYTMVVDVDGKKFYGTGHSKRNAKLIAAEKVLAYLQLQNPQGSDQSSLQQGTFVKVEKPEVKRENAGDVEVPVTATTNNTVNTTAAPKEVPSPYTPLTEEQKRLQMIGKNPVMMLHEIRPNFHSEIVTVELPSDAQRSVEIIFEVDGVQFSGTGRSKKRARARAAQKALETLFGLEFTDFGEDEIPVYLGDDTLWRKFTKKGEKKTAAPPLGKPVKNALMQLNDMYKALVFNFSERTGPDHCPFFKVTLQVENQTYEGSGSTKKAAKMDAADKALTGLQSSGILEQRAKKKQQKTNMQKSWRPQSQQEGRGGKSGSYPHLGESFKPAGGFTNGGKAGKVTNDAWNSQGTGRGTEGWNTPAWMSQDKTSDTQGTASGSNSYSRGRGWGRGRGGAVSGPRGRGRGSRGGTSTGWGTQGSAWETDSAYGQYTDNYCNNNYGDQTSWGPYNTGYTSSYDGGYDTYQGDGSQWGQEYYSY